MENILIIDKLSLYRTFLTVMGSVIHAYLHREEGVMWNADYWYSRAGKERPDISLPLLQKAIKLNSENFEGYYNLACSYAGLKQKNKMIDALNMTINKAPNQMRRMIKDHIKSDSDFSEYYNDSDFYEILA